MSIHFSVVFITVDTAENARQLATGLVAQKLAACANIIGPIQSVYWWENAIQNEAEWLLMCKTETDKWPDLEQWVLAHHPYTVPEIIRLPVEAGQPAYLSWISETLARPDRESIT